MKHYYILTYFFLFTCFSFSSLAQSKEGSARPATAFKSMLKGKVVDGESKQPLEYATVTLFGQNDSMMITGGVTDEKGDFSVDVHEGAYFVKVEFISYFATMIEKIVVKKGQEIADLGVIPLTVAANNLAEVEVRAEVSQMQLTLDKKVFNVGKDLANTGGNAADVLDNVPSVQVDIEGNVTLRGTGNVRILIDGKPSGLIGRGGNGLRSIPANMIDRVEVITNPSARYEAEGMTGILNIVLRKERKNGLNGSFDINTGIPHNHGAAVNLNYRQNKFNLFLNYGMSYRKGPGTSTLDQELFRGDTIFRLDQDSERERGGWSNSFRFGSDFFINPNNTITASFLYRKSNEDNISEINYRDFISIQNEETYLGNTLRTDNESEDEHDLEYQINYKRAFRGKGHELTADFQFEEDGETEKSKFLEKYFSSNGTSTGVADLRQRSANKESQKRWLTRIDYVYPFSKEGKFEVGYHGSFRQIRNDYLVEEFDDIIWAPLVDFNNNFNYDEKINGVYASFGNKHNKFSYQIGVRGEHSDVRTELEQTQEVNPRDYFNFFPTIHLTYDLPQDNSIQISYSRRIQRPRFWYLNPFFTFSDSRNQFSGNPDLDPEFTDSYEIGHLKYWEKGSMTSAIYYRKTTDLIRRVTRILDEDGRTLRRPENLATEDAYGLEMTFSYNPVKWWRLNGDLNFYRSIVDGTNLDPTIYLSSTGLESDNFSWFGRLTSRMTIAKELDMQLRFNYRAATKTPQGETKAMYHMDLTFSRDVLKKKGTLTLSVRDVFNGRRRRYITRGGNFFSEGDFQWRARQITLALNYRLNQKKERGGNRRGGGDFQGGGIDF